MKADARWSKCKGGPAEGLPEWLRRAVGIASALEKMQGLGFEQGRYGPFWLDAHPDLSPSEGSLPLGLDNRFWLGVNTAVSGDTNPVPLFLAGGWLGQGLVPGRPLDVLALGYGRSSFNSQLEPGLTAEAVLELNYSFNLTANLSLQPVLQWVLNPGGSGQVDDILAAGLQLQLQF